MLTQRQRDLLQFITSYQADRGYSPTLEEMAGAMGLASKSNAWTMVGRLEARGYVRRLPNRARCVEVIRAPHEAAPPAPAAGRILTVPHRGTLFIESPALSIRNPRSQIQIPGCLVDDNAAGLFALDLDSDTMIEAGINRGDTVILRKGAEPRLGDIVLAVVDGWTAKLRRFRRKDGQITLVPACAWVEDTTVYAEGRIEILGWMVGLIRRYAELSAERATA